MVVTPTAVLTIVLLAFATATSDESLDKGASEINTPQAFAAYDLTRDQLPKGQYLSEQRNEDLDDADPQGGVNNDEQADDSTALGAIKSDPQDDVENADNNDDENEIGNDEADRNSARMSEFQRDFHEAKDANAKSVKQNDAKEDWGNSDDADLQDNSLDAWEKAPESGTEAENQVISTASVKKDPSLWHRSGGFSFRRRASSGWSSRRRSSGVFSRRGSSWFTRRTTVGRRPWFGRRSIGQRRSSWFGRTRSRGGSTWRQRVARGWGATRRRASSRGGWLTRRTRRSPWLRRTTTRRGRTWGLRKMRRWGARRASSRGGWLTRRTRRSSWFRRTATRRGRAWGHRKTRGRGSTRRRVSFKRKWWKRRGTRLRRTLPVRRVRSRSQRRRSWIGRKFRRTGRIFRKRVIRRSIKARRRVFSRRVASYLKVKKGQLTFNWEGNNNKKSRHYSRKPSVPSSSSGITIGRGYDMGKKSKQQVLTDLIKAGISDKLAELLAKGAELVGKVAEAFLQKNNLNNVEITEQQQKELFKISYARQEAEVKRLTTKYYKTKWSSLHPKIQEMLIDMKFRGDFRPKEKSAAQLALKAAVQQNNVKMFTEVLKNRSYWPNVPLDRFNQRVKFLEQKSR